MAHRPILWGLGGIVGKRDNRLVSLLHLQAGKINARAQHTRGRSCFKAAQAHPQLSQRFRQKRRREQAVRPALIGDISHVDFAAEIGARSEHHAFCGIARTHARHCLPGAVFIAEQVHNLALLELQIRLELELMLHDFGIFPPIDLRAQGMHRRALAQIQHSALNGAGVRRLTHFAAKRVNLTHKVALRRSSNGGIARAVAHRVEIDGEDHRAAAEPRGSQGRFNSGVARADYNHIVLICLIHRYFAPDSFPPHRRLPDNFSIPLANSLSMRQVRPAHSLFADTEMGKYRVHNLIGRTLSGQLQQSGNRALHRNGHRVKRHTPG